MRLAPLSYCLATTSNKMVIRIDIVIAQLQMRHINVARWQHCYIVERAFCGWTVPGGGRGRVANAGELAQNPFRSITHKLYSHL